MRSATVLLALPLNSVKGPTVLTRFALIFVGLRVVSAVVATSRASVALARSQILLIP